MVTYHIENTDITTPTMGCHCQVVLFYFTRECPGRGVTRPLTLATGRGGEGGSCNTNVVATYTKVIHEVLVDS